MTMVKYIEYLVSTQDGLVVWHQGISSYSPECPSVDFQLLMG